MADTSSSLWGGLGDFLNNGLGAWVEVEKAKAQADASASSQEQTRTTAQRSSNEPADYTTTGSSAGQPLMASLGLGNVTGKQVMLFAGIGLAAYLIIK